MSIKDWPGGVVSKDQVVPSGPYLNSTASGIWTMDQVANYTKQGIWPTAGNVEPDVASVFSTYLYTGNSTSQTIENGIKLGGNLAGPYTEFSSPVSGNGGYLYRSSDLTSNTDSKTLTFSCWANSRTGSNFRIYYNNASAASDWRFFVTMSSTSVFIKGYNSSGTLILDTGLRTVALDTWYNFLISVDLSNTSNRYFYINDVEELGPSSTWSTYTDDTIDFTNSHHYVKHHKGSAANTQGNGGVAQLYLDYTYRDLSVASNRRTFINADVTPAGGLSSLNPILYLPLDYTNSTGTNLGTGGDFVAYNTGEIEAKEKGGPGIDSGGGEGGLVWIKNRGNTVAHALFDSTTSFNSFLESNSTASLATISGSVTPNANGFSLSGGYGVNNNNANTYASWTFRKAKKFFDVVTYTGTGVAGLTVSHNLGSVPGMILLKRTDTSGGGWRVYHRSANGGTNPEQYYAMLQSTNAFAVASTVWNNTAPTDSVFTVGTDGDSNTNNGTYVAYLFAHETNADSMIQCGSYTGNGSTTGPVINLGWEPQWLLVKKSSDSDNWYIFDSMRGFITGANENSLYPNTNAAEVSTTYGSLTATGWSIDTSSGALNQNGETFIYMAIRAPMMMAPTAGTQVFYPSLVTATQANQTKTGVGFSADVIINLVRSNANYGQQITSRLTGVNKQLFTNYTAAEGTANGTALVSLDMDGYSLGSDSASTGWNAYSGYTSCKLNFKRAKGYFDVVTYTGTGSVRTVTHSLGVAPEMIWFKSRDAGENWIVYAEPLGATKGLYLNAANAAITSPGVVNNTLPTDSVFTPSAAAFTNVSGQDFIAYLFASLDGISKVGSYTGTAATLSVDCGFTGGARFVLIKRTDSGGDWYIWDSARGISAGNDPYMALNSASAEVTGTDYVDPLNTGFTVTSSAPAGLNASGGNYIFYAIA